jgi:FMN-dependent NADH-azoreductase
MKNILLVQSSPRLEQSTSRKVAENFINIAKSKYPELSVTVRDLTKTPVPHVDNDLINSYFTAPADRSKEANEIIKFSDTLTDELLAADAIVLALPMWNFGVPSVVKAWIDHVSRAGRTFTFTDQGPLGLAKGKKVYVVVTSGSVFSKGPFQKFDMLEPYLRTFFGFIGIEDLTIIRAEGIRDAADEASAISKTNAEIASIFSA